MEEKKSKLKEIKKIYDEKDNIYREVEFIEEDEEPKFEISESLHSEVFKEMPNNLTPEEKAIYVYIKLCKNLIYDDKFQLMEDSKEKEERIKFDKERLESIEVGSEVICTEFSRICVKLLNEIEGVHATSIIMGQHRLTGFETEKYCVKLEPTEPDRYTNLTDIAKAHYDGKYGDQYDGNHCIWNINLINKKNLTAKENGEFSDKEFKILELVFDEELQDIMDPIKSSLRKIQDNTIDEAELKMQSFMEMLKKRSKGKAPMGPNEITQMLIKFKKYSFFSFKNMSFLKTKDENVIKKIIAIQYQDICYLIDTVNLEIEKENLLDVLTKIEEGKFSYVDNKRTLEYYGKDEKIQLKMSNIQSELDKLREEENKYERN